MKKLSREEMEREILVNIPAWSISKLEDIASTGDWNGFAFDDLKEHDWKDPNTLREVYDRVVLRQYDAIPF